MFIKDLKNNVGNEVALRGWIYNFYYFNCTRNLIILIK